MQGIYKIRNCFNRRCALSTTRVSSAIYVVKQSIRSSKQAFKIWNFPLVVQSDTRQFRYSKRMIRSLIIIKK